MLRITNLSRLLLLLTIPLTADTAPANVRFAKRQSLPWVLTNITVFNAKPTSAGASYITFTFNDNSTGPSFTTQCTRFVLPGAGATLMDVNYYPCANDTVGFTYSGTQLAIRRSFLDPAVGPPGEDVVTAFGHANTSFTVTERACGCLETQKRLLVPITGLIA